MKSKQQIDQEYRIKTLNFLACVGYSVRVAGESPRVH